MYKGDILMNQETGTNQNRNKKRRDSAKDPLFGDEKIKLCDPSVEMKSADGFLPNPIQYIGEEDAAIEWNKDPEMAEKRFLYTGAYRSFAESNALILLGRTGTGKTSILRCMYEEIEQRRKGVEPEVERLKAIENYDLAFIVQFKDILPALAKEGIDFSAPTTIYDLPKIIKMWVHTMMMLEIVKNKSVQRSIQSIQLTHIKGYLEKKLLYRNNHVVEGGIRSLLDSVNHVAHDSGNFGLLFISDFINNLLEAGYEDALKEMYAFLSGKRALVLVDTVNEYDLRDRSILLCTKALIATCFQFYEDSTRDRIWLKISLPSEIYTMLVDSLPGKQRHNTVVIQWSSKELIKMIAIRLLECQDKGYIQFDSPFKYKNFYDTDPNAYDNAMELISEILPEKCPTSLWIGGQQENNRLSLICPTIH